MSLFIIVLHALSFLTGQVLASLPNYQVQALTIQPSISNSQTEVQMWLERGLQAEQAGDFETALQIWEEASTELDGVSSVIGSEYIRLATEYGLNDFYQQATSMYLWGMSDEAMSDWNQQAIRDEILRLEPIVDEDEFDEWEEMMDSGNSELPGRIRAFWNQKDPLLGRPGNERLIEHWVRIAHARREFTLRDDAPYGTDARGRYFVQYGEPFSIIKGTFHVNPNDIRKVFWLVRDPGIGMFEVTTYSESGERFVSPGTESLSNQNSRFAIEDSLTEIRAADLVGSVIMHSTIMDLQYEVWRYPRMNDDMQYNLVLLFGKKANGRFDRLETVEDMIHGSLFSTNTSAVMNPDPNFSPGHILQYLFYEQLEMKDPYFGHLFGELYMERQRYGYYPPKTLGMDMRSKNWIRTRQFYAATPEEVSTEERKLPDIPIDVFQYRMMDEEGVPYLLSIVESRPTTAFYYDYGYNSRISGSSSFNNPDSQSLTERPDIIEDASIDFYRLIHGLQLGDEIGSPYSQTRFQSHMIIDTEEDTPSQSVFDTPYISKGTRQDFYVELENRNPESEPRIQSVFPDEIRGIGRTTLYQPASLVEQTEGLLLSDLILGYQKEEFPTEDVRLPFVVSNNRQIPQGENLVIHFETYRLRQNESDISSFEISYEIRSVRQFLFWDRVQRQRDYSISLNFQTDDDRFSETLEIETQALSAGEYELRWAVRDLISGDEESQQIRFVITE